MVWYVSQRFFTQQLMIHVPCRECGTEKRHRGYEEFCGEMFLKTLAPP